MAEQDIDVDSEFERTLAEFKGEQVAEVVPVVEEEIEQVAEVAKQETAEDKAKAMGWSADKEKYEAENPDKEWVSAKTYLRMRDMANEISKSHKEIKQVKRDSDRKFSKLSEQVERLTKGETEKAVKDIEAQLREAVSNQDFDEVERLTNQKIELKQQPIKKDEPLAVDDDDDDQGETKEQLKQAADKWIAENPWYNKLTQAGREKAAKLEADYRAQVDCTTEEALAYVAEEMGKDPIVSALKSKLKPPTVTPRTAERAKPAGTYSASQLSGADRQMYESLKKSNVWKTPADEQNYLKRVLSN